MKGNRKETTQIDTTDWMKTTLTIDVMELLGRWMTLEELQTWTAYKVLKRD